MAPGVSVFREGLEYVHGGATLQETLTPILKVRASMTSGSKGKIASVKWVGLRLQVQVEGDFNECKFDIRTRPADESTSILAEDQRDKSHDDGKVSILVASDDLVGQAAVLVVIKADKVIIKHPLTIGEN